MTEPQESPWRIRSKVWLERDQQVLLSDFRATLLERIDALGSVSAAAQDLDLPNRTAWKKLQEMEAAAGFTLLHSSSGGAGGGASRLTPDARAMLAAFHRVADPAAGLVTERFADEGRHFPTSGPSENPA